MTNGDKIREMDDWNLAVMFETALSEYGKMICEKLSKYGIDVDLVETPVVSRIAHLEWLRTEVDE